MKKTLVLASLLAAFGAASAQSSVTLYGQGDIGLGKSSIVTGSAVTAANNNQLQMNPTGADIGGFRFGLRGSEGLGNGLTAKFQLESNNFNADVADTKLDFSRAAWLGLAGGFGEVRLGRHATVAVMNSGTQTNFGWRGTNSQVHLGLRGGIDCQTAVVCGAAGSTSSRMSAALTFLSANYSGFTFATQASLKGDGYYGATGTGSQFAVGYSAGPLKAEANTTNMGGQKTTYIGAQYALGATTLALGSMKAGTNKGITARVKQSFGAAAVGLEMTKETTGAKRTGTELGMDYNLSPRTALTVAVNKTTGRDLGSFAGVRHAF